MATLRNGLTSLELGAFDTDPETDSVFEASEKIQKNFEVIDEALGTVSELDSDMDTLEKKGLLLGFVHGGSF